MNISKNAEERINESTAWWSKYNRGSDLRHKSSATVIIGSVLVMTALSWSVGRDGLVQTKLVDEKVIVNSAIDKSFLIAGVAGLCSVISGLYLGKIAKKDLAECVAAEKGE
jgi:cytochrome bd-type quinol oxidase subunit 1